MSIRAKDHWRDSASAITEKTCDDSVWTSGESAKDEKACHTQYSGKGDAWCREKNPYSWIKNKRAVTVAGVSLHETCAFHLVPAMHKNQLSRQSTRPLVWKIHFRPILSQPAQARSIDICKARTKPFKRSTWLLNFRKQRTKEQATSAKSQNLHRASPSVSSRNKTRVGWSLE